MIDMDTYEQKYNEALERAKKWEREHPHGYVIKDMMEYIFPELRESEDERIRKELVQFLTEIKSISEGGRDSWHVRKEDAKMCTDFLAYLEKQKEPHYTKRNALFDKCVAECDPAIMKEVSDEIDEMLGKEQKPAEWSEEDEKFLNYAISMTDDAQVKRILKSLRPSWKPSEEQLLQLRRAISGCSYDIELLVSLEEQLKQL